MLIHGGTGNGYAAKVDEHNRFRTYATIESELSHASENHGASYVWTASDDINTTDSIIWLRNDNTTENLIIECISVNNNIVGSWFIYCPTGTTADGNVITGVNSNRQSGKVALATCRSDATLMTIANYVYYGASMASEDKTVEFHGGLVLGYLDEVAVDITTETTVLAQATIMGYYHSVD
jgi:hypothetical protein